MEIRNYLARDRIHYSIALKQNGNQTIQLWEHIDGMQREFNTMLAVVYSWRADVIQVFLDRLVASYREDLRKSLRSAQMTLDTGNDLSHVDGVHWQNEYRIPEEVAMKMLVAMKLVSSMDQRTRIEEALEIVHALSDEEISFWAWKTLSLKTAALNGFKAMYL